MTGRILHSPLGVAYKVRGYVRTPQGSEVRFVELLSKRDKASKYVHTVTIQNGIEAEPIATYTELTKAIF